KHAVKQVDRLLSNPGIEAWDIFATWVPEMVGSGTGIVGGMDWTECDAQGAKVSRVRVHRGAVPGRRGRVRARQGHEGALVPGRQRRSRDRAADHRAVLEAVAGGAQFQ